MRGELVSIITRTKDRAVLLRRAVDTALSQRHQAWEQIIVNDGGDPAAVDALVAPLRARGETRVQVLHHPRSLGMEAASNAGVRLARGAYLVILDDDDSWHPEFLGRCVGFLQAHAHLPGLGAVATRSVKIVERIEGQRVVTLGREPFNPGLQAVTLFRMAAGNTLTTNSLLMRRSAWDAVGAYREDLPVLGDWEFNLRFLRRFDIGLIPEELAYYHHRAPRSAPRGAYSNSVIGGHDQHVFYDALLRNQLLREDLDRGVVGLGLLVHLAKGLEDGAALLRRDRRLRYIEAWSKIRAMWREIRG